MRRSGVWNFAAAALLAPLLAVALASPAGAEWVWTKETGWFRPSSAVKQTADELRKQADKAFDELEFADATTGYRMLLLEYPTYPEVPLVLVKLLDAQFYSKEYEDALDTADAILAKKPDTATLSKVVGRQYEIGRAYLDGAPTHFLFFSMSGESRGLEVLDSVVKKYPYQPYSDDALFYIGEYYFREQSYEDAQVAYKRVVDEYPDSEWAGIAEYQLGETAFRQLKGVDYDLAPLREAERRLSRYLSRNPGGDRAEDARTRLAQIDKMKAERLYTIAIFYERELQPRSAEHYYEQVLRDYPDSPFAEGASAKLKELRTRTEKQRERARSQKSAQEKQP